MIRRSGFTVIELLIVLSIIGILASLMLPAVQAAREAARKVSCQNNLKQVGIALHAYHNTYRTLPTGCVEWRAWNSPPTHRQFAWSAFLLPFLELQNLHDQINFDVPFDAAENTHASSTRVSVYECPTATSRELVRGQSDYGGLFGEKLVDRNPADGLFLYEYALRFRDVTDGLSVTVAVSEDVGGPDSEWINGRNVFVQSHGINDSNAWIGDNEIRSLHGGGAMLLFIDGHVQFVTESIDKKLLGSLITRAGREPVSGVDQ